MHCQQAAITPRQNPFLYGDPMPEDDEWGYDTNTNDRRLIGITNSGITRSYTIGYGSGPVNVYDIQSITDTAAIGHPWATQSHSYTNDLIDRLLTASATTPGNFAYGYDNLDNPTTVTNPSGTTNPTFTGLNQINNWGSLSYAYDADGNTLSGDGTRTYKWDAENRLIEIDYVGTSNKSIFSYDGVGHRTVDAETASGTTTTTRYLWCGSRICQTRNGSDTVLRRDLREGEFNVSSGQKLIYMPDQLGSVRDVLDGASGSLVQSYDYAPYGAVAETNGSTPTDYQYAGLFAHPASGLNLSFTRPQDGTTGRWLGRDLIREAAGSNLYRYGPNTINGTDPLGLEFVIRLPGLPGIPLLPPVFWPGTPENQQFVRSQMQWIQWILNNDTADEPKAGSCPKPEDIQGKTPEEIDDMMEGKGWQGEPTSGEGGTRYPNPDVPGEQVRVMPGNPADPNPVKQGPYGRISTGGGVSAPIPLQGNPTLSR